MKYFIELKLVRSFGVGVRLYSPKYNGFCLEIMLTCFAIQIWSRGDKLFAYRSYWS